MSFRCENCGEPQPPRTRPNQVVIKKRERTYNPNQSITLGWEIRKVIRIGPCCTDEIREAPTPGWSEGASGLP